MQLLTIVIPVFNQASYLAETIHSVLAQQPTAPECIVVDDGSTDGSGDVARSFGDRIVFVSQANAGQSAALNAGWAKSSARFVGYLGADDLLDPTATPRLLQIAKAQTKNVIVFPGFRDIDSAGAVIRQCHPKPASIVNMAHGFRCDIGPGAIFSRAVLDEVGGWDERFSQMPDFEFWMRAARVSDVVFLPEVLASWRVHPGSQTRAVSSVVKADEPCLLATLVRKNPERYLDGIDINRLEAAGNILSACLHIRSGRFGLGWQRWRDAFNAAPGVAVQAASLRRLARTSIDGIALSQALERFPTCLNRKGIPSGRDF